MRGGFAGGHRGQRGKHEQKQQSEAAARERHRGQHGERHGNKQPSATVLFPQLSEVTFRFGHMDELDEKRPVKLAMLYSSQ
jgi:hypothetical protein